MNRNPASRRLEKKKLRQKIQNSHIHTNAHTHSEETPNTQTQRNATRRNGFKAHRGALLPPAIPRLEYYLYLYISDIAIEIIIYIIYINGGRGDKDKATTKK